MLESRRLDFLLIFFLSVVAYYLGFSDGETSKFINPARHKTSSNRQLATKEGSTLVFRFGRFHLVFTLVKKPLRFLKVCTRVQSSEMTKFHDIFEDQKIDKMDIIFCHDPQIAKCKNQFH